MKPDARLAFGTPLAAGNRLDPRATIAVPATLHVDEAAPRAVTVRDLTSRGCRLVAAGSDLPVAAHCALMLDGRTLISGRVAWNDGAGLGIDFCTPLLPRIVARLLAMPHRDRSPLA